MGVAIRVFSIRWAVLACLTAVLAVPSPVMAQAQDSTRSPYTFSTGFDFTTGNYGGAENTDIIQIPNRVAYDLGQWSFSATAPYLLISGPGNTINTGSGLASTDQSSSSGSTTENGIGDIVLGVTRRGAQPENALYFIDYTAKLKLPTADESAGLGTGEIDISGQIDGYLVRGAFVPFAGVGYQFLGDMPGQALNDGFFLSLGGQYSLTPEFKLGLVLDYKQAATNAQEDPLEVSPSIEMAVTERAKANFYAIMGLSDGSPDFGFGVQIMVR